MKPTMSHNQANILALIYLPKWHLESEELSLAFEMLKKSLMYYCDIQISHQAISSEILRSSLLSGQTSYQQCIMVDSACLLSPQWLATAQNYWLKNKAGIPLVFSSLSDHPNPEAYYTLYGFHQYCRHLTQDFQQNSLPDTLAYDQRNVHAMTFLTSSLEQLNKQSSDDLLVSLYSQSVILRPLHYHFFGHYYSGSREDILALIPKQIDSLLDIGCGTGEFARQVKDTLNILVEGIEANTYQASLAGQKLDQVYTADANQLQLEKRYDFITCLDMIEHLPRAEGLLKKIATQWLKPGGQLLLSVPNVAHWSIVEELLAGEFNYIPAGLLCNTHRRFYTKKSMTALLESQGFTVLKIIPQITPIPDRIKHSIESIDDIMNIDQESLQTHDYKFLVRT